MSQRPTIKTPTRQQEIEAMKKRLKRASKKGKQRWVKKQCSGANATTAEK